MSKAQALIPATPQVVTVVPPMSFTEMEHLAQDVAQSGMFGIKTKQQALVLMCLAQAEGRHPAEAARDYDIIQGRPAKKAEAMMRDFQRAGGKVEWKKLTDSECEAVFSHPSAPKPVPVNWDLKRAKVAGLAEKDTWRKYPRQMLRSRVVSEGVRTVFPAATSGMYVPEEVTDFEPTDVAQKVMAQIEERSAIEPPPPLPETPVIEAPVDPETGVVSPHELVVGKTNDLPNWLDFGTEIIAALQSAKTRDEGEQWVDLNEKSIKECPDRVYNRVHGQILKMRERFKTVQSPV